MISAITALNDRHRTGERQAGLPDRGLEHLLHDLWLRREELRLTAQPLVYIVFWHDPERWHDNRDSIAMPHCCVIEGFRLFCHLSLHPLGQAPRKSLRGKAILGISDLDKMMANCIPNEPGMGFSSKPSSRAQYHPQDRKHPPIKSSTHSGISSTAKTARQQKQQQKWPLAPIHDTKIIPQRSFCKAADLLVESTDLFLLELFCLRLYAPFTSTGLLSPHSTDTDV